jgi:hypothetical protein
MEELIRRFIANGFADFEGLQVHGSVPVRQELVNEIIAEVLKGGLPLPGASSGVGGVSGDAGTSSAPKLELPLPELLKMVQRAEVKATDGKITLEFEIRR